MAPRHESGGERLDMRADNKADEISAPADRSRPVVLSVQSLTKRFGAGASERLILDSVSVDVRPGEFACIVGPSGAGKTTLLRCMAGLLSPNSGGVYLDGQLVDSPPRKVAVVFQDYSRSLLPWMRVLGNVTLPLRNSGKSKAEQQKIARDALAAVRLAGHEGLYPWQMSGGMQQRVAIARALAFQPEALLMDEPFASVDAQTRADLEDMILRIRNEFGMTVVLVTHDIDEAVYLADQVVVLSGNPASVRATLDVPFGPIRDQIGTKSRPEFMRLRNHVLELVRGRRAALGETND
jgi:NitT/TauT family transport system ATP-binding protein